MSAQHSPGPWWATESGVRNRGGYIVHTNSVQRYEGQDERYEFEVAQREADKQAIAAAPEMLAALIVAREFISIDRQALADCSTAPDGSMEPDDALAVADYDQALRQIDAAIAKATGEQP